MCLENIDIDATLALISQPGPIVGYKYLQKVTFHALGPPRLNNESEVLIPVTPEISYRSPHNNFTWVKGEVQKSSRAGGLMRDTISGGPRYTTCMERRHGQIDEGFHFFFTPADAIESIKYYLPGGFCIAKFEIQPADVVAVGSYGPFIMNDSCPNFVAHRAKFVGVYE